MARKKARRADEKPPAHPTRAAPVPLARGCIPALVFLSGGSALIYESLWLRSFGLIFGNTTDTIAVTLSVFMAGLALGGFLTTRWRCARPFVAYACCEAGAGLTALATVPLLAALQGAFLALAGHDLIPGTGVRFVRALCASLIVLPTTTLLGAALPLLLEALSRARSDFRADFGRLYRINTLGGVAGTLGGTFALVPLVGVRATLLLAGLVSIGVGLAAWVLQRRLPAAGAAPPDTTAAPEAPRSFVMTASCTGLASLALEVLWTRSYTLVVGSSVYSFSLMLAAFLSGLAFGTSAYERVRLRIRAPQRFISVCLIAVGVSILASPVIIGMLPIGQFALIRTLPLSFGAQQLGVFALCFVSMLLVTPLFGLVFPALTHLRDLSGRGAQSISGSLYAWNTVGAIAGVLIADLLLVPHVGLERSFVLVAAAPLGLGLWQVTAAGTSGRLPRTVHRLLALGALALLLVFLKPWDPLLMTAGVYRYGIEWRDRDPSASALAQRLAAERRLLFYREGSEAVVSVIESRQSGARFLALNGKTDAGNGPQDLATQKLIAHVPLVLHPEARRALVIGWGSGATAASAALHPLERIDCLEIEPATYGAASLFPDLNGWLQNDRRFKLAFADARGVLLARGESYDVILSEPSNPWLTGVANLFTRDFYQAALQRLAPDGVFCQWFHYYNLSWRDVLIEMRTFAEVFQEVTLWAIPPTPTSDGTQLTADVLLIGSRSPRRPSLEQLAVPYRDERLRADLLATGVARDPLALAAAYALDRDDMQRLWDDKRAFPRGVPVNTDDRPIIEFAAPRGNVAPPEVVLKAALDVYRLLTTSRASLLPPFVDEHRQNDDKLLLDMGRAYWMAGILDRAERIYDAVLERRPGSAEALAASGEILLVKGQREIAIRRLEQALAADPENGHTYDVLGSFHYNAGEIRTALDLYAEWVRRAPDSAQAHYKLAVAKAQLHDWDGARRSLRSALDRDSGLTEASDLLATIESRYTGRPK